MTRDELIEKVTEMREKAYAKMGEPYLDLRYYQGRYHAFDDVVQLLKGEEK